MEIETNSPTDPIGTWTPLAPVADARALGRALRACRKHAGLDQAELARRLGTYRTNLSRIENGHAVEQLDLVLASLRELGFELAIQPRTGARG